jgi:chemotaxis protein histidine kinase CheA
MTASTNHLLSLFMSEAERKLAEMEAGWKALNEGTTDAPAREALSRGAQSLTGEAAMMGLWGLAEFAGAIERMSNAMPQSEKVDDVILRRLREYLDDLRTQVHRVRNQLQEAV